MAATVPHICLVAVTSNAHIGAYPRRTSRSEWTRRIEWGADRSDELNTTQHIRDMCRSDASGLSFCERTTSSFTLLGCRLKVDCFLVDNIIENTANVWAWSLNEYSIRLHMLCIWLHVWHVPGEWKWCVPIAYFFTSLPILLFSFRHIEYVCFSIRNLYGGFSFTIKQNQEIPWSAYQLGCIFIPRAMVIWHAEHLFFFVWSENIRIYVWTHTAQTYIGSSGMLCAIFYS